MTSLPDSPPAPALGRRTPDLRRGAAAQTLARMPRTRLLGLGVVTAAAAVLNTYRLEQNGYANIFYSAGVKSMLSSLHNFVFVAFDPGGLISVDKPPLALWVQAASAKLFGFAPLSLLLPEAIFGVLTVAALYLILVRRLGVTAAVTGALALAAFPSFVAVSRENGVDPLLILLLVLACGAGIRACENGRWRWIVSSGVLVGLAFNTKTLAAYLAVPGIAVAYLLCAPGPLLRRGLALALAGLAMAAVSFSWIAFVEATPASKRPYVGSSTDNTEVGLAFEYNGVGRVEGQAGGPNTTVARPGARVPAKHKPKRSRRPAVSRSSALTGGGIVNGRHRYPIPFGGSPGPLRLFGVGLGDQGAWMIPFALFGLIAAALLAVLEQRGATAARPRAAGPADAPPLGGRRDPRLATLIVLGGWFLVEAIVLSSSKGIVHPYYVSALGPGTGAMAGVGVYALLALARGRLRLLGLLLAALAVTATVAAQVVLAHREHYMVSFVPVLAIGAIVLLGALVAMRMLALPAVMALFALLMVLPTGYASTTWLAPVEGTFPAAGPRQAAGARNGYGVNDRDLGIDRALAAYVSSHRPGSRWALLTVASDTASPMMLLGLQAGALGGYSGTDPALDGRGLARYVERGEARWILLGGEYSLRGGNLATKAVLRACRQIAPSVWHSPVAYPFGLTLFDCAGRERRLAA
jgi:4-amino-4-deoxy-L-arabinose transferase-like glycosyltransferase